MPFKSKAQRAFLYMNHPEVAKEFAAATPKGKKLPDHKAKAGMKQRAHSAFMKGLYRGK